MKTTDGTCNFRLKEVKKRRVMTDSEKAAEFVLAAILFMLFVPIIIVAAFVSLLFGRHYEEEHYRS